MSEKYADKCIYLLHASFQHQPKVYWIKYHLFEGAHLIVLSLLLFIFVFVFISALFCFIFDFDSICKIKDLFGHLFRSSRPEVFLKKDVLRNFTKFIGKHLCQSPFINKVAGLRPAIFFKKRFWHRRFPANFTKFLRTPFFIEHF